MNDISIDCETLSTRPTAAVISIGAVAFNRKTGELGKEFYREIRVDDAIKYGHVSGDTLSWWMGNPSARVNLFTANDKAHALDTLAQLSEFVRGFGPDVKVWANGAANDIPWLENLYLVAGRDTPTPRHFRNMRDLRTLRGLAGDPKFPGIEFTGVKHNALDDAKHQARLIHANLSYIKTTYIKPVTMENDDGDKL